jgi:hypothetical protein
MKRKTWKSKLNKKEAQHLKDNGIKTIADFRRTRALQIADLKTGAVKYEPCFDCRHIAIKLGEA